MNNKLIVIILIIVVIMMIMESILLLLSLFLFAKNEKQTKKITEEDRKIEIKTKLKEKDNNEYDMVYWKIEIPKINISANIKEGWDFDIINNSIGHLKSNNRINDLVVLKSLINENNKYFERISELKIGEQIIYKYNEQINKYIIVENKIIANEKEKIKIASKEQIILLTNVKDLPKVSRCIVGQIIEE